MVLLFSRDLWPFTWNLFSKSCFGLIPVPLTEASKDKESRMWLRSYLHSEICLFEGVRRKLLFMHTVIPYP